MFSFSLPIKLSSIAERRLLDIIEAALQRGNATDAATQTKLDQINRKLDGLGAIVQQLTQLAAEVARQGAQRTADAEMAQAAREAKAVIEDAITALDFFTPGR